MRFSGGRRRPILRWMGRVGSIAELRRKIGDSGYLDLAIRCLANIFSEDATRGPRT